MKATITVGISASGKTTWAKLQNAAIISRDNIRHALLENDGFDAENQNIWSKWNFKREKEVTEYYWKLVEFAAGQGDDIILADTNLNKVRSDEMARKLLALGYSVEFKQFDISYEEAIKRDKNRKDTVGEKVIYKQWLELYGEKYEPSTSLPSAIIVDIDGTLAHMDGKRGPFEWHNVGKDRVDVVVKHIVNSMGRNHDVIVISGRDGSCFDETCSWLNLNGVSFDNILMRSAGDMRKDSIIKKELFDEHIRDKYNVICVFDDRPQVVREWHRMGLRVIACGDQMKEF